MPNHGTYGWLIYGKISATLEKSFLYNRQIDPSCAGVDMI